MRTVRYPCWPGFVPILVAALAVVGCRNTPIDYSEYEQGPAPLRMARPSAGEPTSYEGGLTGGRVFAMYCGACHNARSLGERPFSNYQNVATHMRVRANLTGVEYAELMAWLRRWHDVPPPNPPVEPSPKRFFFSQPISELREATSGAEAPADKPPAVEAPAPPAPPKADSEKARSDAQP